MLRLLPKYRGVPGISFYPDTDGLLYYKNPFDDRLYIDINYYFDYLNAARADEIEAVAQMLGAKHIRIIRKEAQKYYVTPDAKSDSPDEFTNIRVLTDADLDTLEEPVMPELRFLHKNPSLNTLLQNYTNSNQSRENETYTIACKVLDGLPIEDAVKLDAVIQSLNIGGNASISASAESDNRAVLEYSIEY